MSPPYDPPSPGTPGAARPPSADDHPCAQEEEMDEEDSDYLPAVAQEGLCLVAGHSRDILPDLENLNLDAFTAFHTSNFAIAHALLKKGVDVTRLSVVSAQLDPADWQATLLEGERILSLFPQVRLVHCIPTGSSIAFGGLDSEQFEQMMIPAAPHPHLFPALAALFLALDEGFRQISTLGLEVLSIDFNGRCGLLSEEEVLLVTAALEDMKQEFGEFTIECLSDLGCH